MGNNEKRSFPERDRAVKHKWRRYEKNASSMMLTRMVDGSYAMKCTVSVNLKSLDLEGYSFEEITEFIIYLG